RPPSPPITPQARKPKPQLPDAGNKLPPRASRACHNGVHAPAPLPPRPPPRPPRLLHPRGRRLRRRLREPQRRARLRRPARQGGGEPRAHGGGARGPAGSLAHRPPRAFPPRGDPRAPAAAAPAGARPRAGAAAPAVPGPALGVTPADWGPVLWADDPAGVIGAAHAGWRGAATGVLEATIAAMERCGADRGRISVALGPTIRQPNYEVGHEFVSRFLVANATNERFFRPSATPQHALFDLPGDIAARLVAAGMRRIEDLGHCTYADAARFFSYRRSTHRDERDYGRHINAIALVG